MQMVSLDDRNSPQWLRGKCPGIRPSSAGKQREQELEKAQSLVLEMQTQDASANAASN